MAPKTYLHDVPAHLNERELVEHGPVRHQGAQAQQLEASAHPRARLRLLRGSSLRLPARARLERLQSLQRLLYTESSLRYLRVLLAESHLLSREELC